MDIAGFLDDTIRGAGEIVAGRFRQADNTRMKKGSDDLVTKADFESERYIINRIQQAYPTHSIIAEESGAIEPEETPGNGQDACTWIIDPLDGTRNHVLGIPFFCVSMAMVRDGDVDAGAIYDPIHDELFFALRRQGASLNGKPIRVSEETDLEDAVVTVSWLRIADRSACVDYLSLIAGHTSHFRKLGSAALVTAYVAAGRLDAAIQESTKAWDTAAGILIVTEAGGLATDFHGQPVDLTLEEIDVLSANPILHKQIRDRVISNAD